MVAYRVAELLALRYRLYSMKIRCKCWYPTKEAAIASFERNCKRLGIERPDTLHQP